MVVRKPEEVHLRFAEAFNSGNLEALVTLYEAQARVVPEPEQQPVVGIQAIRETFQSFLALKGQIQMETRYVIHAGDIALLRAQWRLAATGADGQPIEMTHNSTEVVRRQPDGTWRYIIDHPFGAD